LHKNATEVLFVFQYDRAQVTDRQGEKNPTNRAKAIMKQLDISGDRKLSREEFLKGFDNFEYSCLLTIFISL